MSDAEEKVDRVVSALVELMDLCEKSGDGDDPVSWSILNAINRKLLDVRTEGRHRKLIHRGVTQLLSGILMP